MGWYIGQDNDVTVLFEGGFNSPDAYLALTDEYYLKNLQMTVGIEVFKSKEAQESGEDSLKTKELKDVKAIQFMITEEQLQGLVTKTVHFIDLILLNVPSVVGEIVEEWSGKLVEDF